MLRFSTIPETLPMKNVYLSPLNTHPSHTNYTVHNLFNVYSNNTTFKVQRIRNARFAVYVCQIPLTLKQSQGHQPKISMWTPSKVHVKFQRSCFNGVRENANVKVFQTRKYVNYLPRTCAKSKIVVYLSSN